MKSRPMSVDIRANGHTRVKCVASGLLNVATYVLTRSYMSRLSHFHASSKIAASISRSWEISRCTSPAIAC